MDERVFWWALSITIVAMITFPVNLVFGAIWTMIVSGIFINNAFNSEKKATRHKEVVK